MKIKNKMNQIRELKKLGKKVENDLIKVIRILNELTGNTNRIRDEFADFLYDVDELTLFIDKMEVQDED